MANQKGLQAAELERYSFLWSQARLIIAAIALFLGGIPPVFFIFRFPALYGLLSALLTVAWIVSGVAAIYLLYRWNLGGKKIFGGNNTKDTAAFFVSIVSGINLGIVGLLGINIGMTITTNRLVFFIVGIIYLLSCYHLAKRWNANQQKLF